MQRPVHPLDRYRFANVLSALAPTALTSTAKFALIAGVVTLLTCGFHSTAHAQGAGMQGIDPEPFRADRGQLFGRRFDYPDDAFLLRSLYRFHVDHRDQWHRNREGFRGLAGSDASDEFYTFQEARKTIAIEDPFFFSFRYRRDEDYDSRYDRAQVGLGSKIGRGWSFALHSEIVAEKEDIDVQPEFEWSDETGNHFRFAFVLADATFNRKSDDGDYKHTPYTLFAEGTKAIGSEGRLTAWINWNPQLERSYLVDSLSVNDRRLFGGVQLVLPLNEQWKARLEGNGEIRMASVRYLDTTDIRDRRLSRRMWQIEGQLRRTINETVIVWFGAKYFRFSENERRPRDITMDNKFSRRETAAFVGVDWRVHERVLLWPSVYVDFLQEREDFQGNAALRKSDHDTLVAIALPIEIDVGKGAALTIQTSVLVHEIEFGGTGVQLSVPF